MNKIALVIGVNDYIHFSTLGNCINDSSDIKKFLEEIGFDVTLINNPKKAELESAIKEYKEKIDNETIAVFYYSGHGIQLENYNFLIPVDSEINAIEDIPFNCTNMSHLFTDISDAIDFTHVVILDACRKNPFSTGLGKVTTGLGIETPRKGTIIAYAASPGKPSIERREERNGLYTKHLLNNLSLSNTSIEQVFKNTRTEVLNDTNNKQLSWEESSLHGNEISFIVKDEVLLKFEKIIEEFIAKDDNLLLPKVYPFSQPKYFHKLSIEHLHFALTLNILAFEKEKDEKVKATIDFDYFAEELINTILPLFQTRIINEDGCENIFDSVILQEIEIINNNYGFNEVLSVEDAFPHFMINQIKYDGKEGLFSCFLSFENGKHFIKPMLFINNETLEIVCYKTLIGDEAVTFFKKFVEIRKPYENEIPNPMEAFENVEVNTLEDLKEFFDFDDNKNDNS